MERTIEVIQKEYADLCTRAGHAAYQISVLEAEIKAIQSSLLALNKEAAELSKSKAEVASE